MSQQNIDKYLDEHRDLIKYAKKGYIQTVRDEFEKKSGCKLSLHQVKKAIADYRKSHNYPISYVSNKYYVPHPANGSAYANEQVDATAATPETNEAITAQTAEQIVDHIISQTIVHEQPSQNRTEFGDRSSAAQNRTELGNRSSAAQDHTTEHANKLEALIGGILQLVDAVECLDIHLHDALTDISSQLHDASAHL